MTEEHMCHHGNGQCRHQQAAGESTEMKHEHMQGGGCHCHDNGGQCHCHDNGGQCHCHDQQQA